MKEPSVVVTNGELARMYGKSPEWARGLLLGWYKDQQAGGEQRVIKRTDSRGRTILETTLAVLQRHMPPARDMMLVRDVARIDHDLDVLARRVNHIAATVEAIERMLGGLTSIQRVTRAITKG